ncbi:S-adenosyl-L-methionine-dependent methyltransferase [Cadophora sp. DSE1049]|nr:S-adenosyl-L-methionine-dependent methyltransferase [Cadophora sp. DSE1049]
MALWKDQDAVDIGSGTGRKYLQEAVQLFTALSSCFDPIMNQDGAQLDIGSVQRAIFHRRWLSNNIQTSFQYLETLFYTQEHLATDVSQIFTSASPIAELRLGVTPPGIVGHSRTTRHSDGSEHQEKLRSNHGSIDGALRNILGEKRNEYITTIRDTLYEDPEDPKSTGCQMPIDYIQQPPGNAPIITNLTQKPIFGGRKSTNNTREETSRGNIVSLVEAHPRPSQPVSSPPLFPQPQDYPPATSCTGSEPDPEPEVESYGSVNFSILASTFENGRRYHSISYQSGKYYLPNDEKELDRMDMQYHMIFNVLLDGRKFLSPIKSPKKILDQCTGTGLWAFEMADAFPEAEVLGIDLRPIQPSLMPPNLKFVLDDVDKDWLFHHATYDFIHCSFGHGYSARDWGFFLSESYRYLAPGGWVEIQDFDITALSVDDSLPGTSAISKWHDKLHEGASLGGINVRASYFDLEQIFKKSGFINVKLEVKPVPCGRWPKDQKLKAVGTWQKYCFEEGLAAYSLAIFTRLLGWSLEEVQVFLAEVRSELGNRAYHWYWPFFVVYGQKPEN